MVIGALAGSARAGGIALESYTGPRPADASRLLSPVLDELAARGFAAGDTLARSYDAGVSRSALTADGLPEGFAAQVDRGFKAWVGGKLDDAVQILGQLVETAHANTGAFAKDQTLRDPLLKAEIGLALSHQRRGDPSAMRAVFGEIVRSFPDAQISRGTYGPEANDAFEQVKRETMGAGKGKLVIKLGDETGVVFVDETYRGVGNTTIDLAPGEYRVCVMMNKQPSRSHRVVVRPGAETPLAIDARLDQTIHTEGWTGLQFAADGDRDAHEAAYAAAFANAIGASAVAVVGIEKAKSRAAIVGSLVSLSTGREIRRASVAMDPDPSTERLRALARFLAGDEPTAGIEVQVGAGAPPRDDETARDEHGEPIAAERWKGYAWITGGVGGAAIVTGLTLVVLDGHCNGMAPMGRPCTNVYQTKTPGFITLGAGAALAAVSIYLFTHPGGSARAAYVAPTTDGAVAGFAGTW